MKLELKHINCYLPYGLKVIVGATERDLTAVSIDSHFCFVTSYKGSRYKQMVGIENIKPILHPLSDLNKEIEVNGERFIPIDLLCSDSYPIDYFVDTDIYNYLQSWIASPIKTHHIHFIPFGLMLQILEWHFDIYKLIENNLAIDINTLK